MNSSIVATSGGDVVTGGSMNFDIDFNESILQVHKRSPLYIIGDRAQHRVSFRQKDQLSSYAIRESLPMESLTVDFLKL